MVEQLSSVRLSLYQPVLVEPYVELRCEQALPGFLAPVAYNLIMILVCAILGYLSRKLPENFNETWHIFISVSTTLFMWLVFLPTYFLAFYAHHQVALLAFCLILNAYITMGCLFLPKIYAILFLKEDQIRFSKTITDVSKICPTYITQEASCSGINQDGHKITTDQIEMKENCWTFIPDGYFERSMSYYTLRKQIKKMFKVFVFAMDRCLYMFNILKDLLWKLVAVTLKNR